MEISLKNRFALVCLFAVIFFSHFAYQVNAASLTKPLNNLGLVGWWTLDEKSGTVAHDFSGNGNTGTLSSSPIWIAGKSGGGLSFPNSDDVIVTNRMSATEGQSQMSWSVWVKDTFTGNNGCFVCKTDASFQTQMAWNIRNTPTSFIGTTNDVSFFLASALDDNDQSASVCTSRGNALKNGEWNHVVVTYDGSQVGNTGRLKFYINNALTSFTGGDCAGTIPAISLVSSAKVTIAGEENGTSRNFDGSVDDVRIYNRVLSPGEISSIYKASQLTKKSAVSNNGLIGWWTFDEGTSTKAHDFSGFNRTGTLDGGPTWTIGKKGGGLIFDGINDRVTVGSLDITGPVSLCTWASWSGAVSDSELISNKPVGGVPLQYNLEIIFDPSDTVNAGSLNMFWSNGGLTVFTSAPNLINQANKWYHICVTRVDENTVYGYLNGVQYSMVKSGTDPIPTTGGTLALGSGGISGDDNHVGSMDDVRIYNRVLSANEVLALYNSSSATVGRNQSNSVSDGLVGYWSFNGQDMNLATNIAYDRSGQGNNGVLTNMVTANAVVAGKSGQALIFNGSNNFVEVTPASAINDVTKKTVCAWVKPTSGGGEIASKEDSTYGGSIGFGWRFFVNSGGGALEFRQGICGGADGYWTIVGSVPVNTWTHVCYVYDNSSVANDPVMYINGASVTVSENQTPAAAACGDSGSSLVIGSAINGAGESVFSGIIDEFRMYNRLLSSSEIKQIYLLGN